MFERIAVLGVGLIGGSFARAAKKQGLCRHVAGCGRNTRNLLRAMELGIIDSFTTDPASSCEGADLVLISSPVGSFRELAGAIAPGLRPGAIVTDAGSVKGDLVRMLEEMMPEGVHFVGAHPIAGSDRSGLEASSDDLFRGAWCIITPTGRSDSASAQKVSALWEALGCRVQHMDPFVHDRVFAAVSHLPHVAAYALVNTVADLERGSLAYAGQGFRDTTRVAASSPEIWRDICIHNRDNLLEMINALRKNLEGMAGMLEASDAAAIEEAFSRARAVRREIG